MRTVYLIQGSIMSSDTKPDQFLDLRGVKCPFNFVKTKLRLETMNAGEVLQVVLDPGEPVSNVPRSAKEEGHAVLGITERPDGLYDVLLKKSGT
jgi:tRNA 2-thiouridine synthesizing protein A